MKLNIYIVMILVLSGLYMSCSDEDGFSGSTDAEVHYVRTTGASDSLLSGATQGQMIAIIGQGLADVREVWLNDRQAQVVATLVTDESVIATIPTRIPEQFNDQLSIVFAPGDTLFFPFELVVSAPNIEALSAEWPQPGDNLVISGGFFYEPLTVIYPGGIEGELISVEEDKIEVAIPDGVGEGTVKIRNQFGQSESSGILFDARNMILDFDTPGMSGNAWRTGLIEGDDNPLNGNYNVFRGAVNPGQRNEGEGASPYLMQHKGWRAGVRPEGNFFDGDHEDYVLKFEARIVDWYGGHLNICMAEWGHGSPGGSNAEIWGNDNARALWAPWEDEDSPITTTDGRWITVSIPLTEFKYSMENDGENIYEENVDFNPNAAGSISMWLLGSAESTGDVVEFHIDNVRIVPL